MAELQKPSWISRNWMALVSSSPMIFTALVVFTGCSIWTILYSFTASRTLPELTFVGFDQYIRLFKASRWGYAYRNILFYGVASLTISFVLGFVMAVLLDQKIRFENSFRTIYLYPFALSFIVTGIAWQWMLDPMFGFQKVVQGWGFTDFKFNLLGNRNTVMYAVLLAGLWQGTGLTMVLMLAGLRTVDEEIWKAARVDGIPKWKTYLFIVLPIMRPVLITNLVISAAGVVRTYDLIVALTKGGPGNFSDVPAKYVFDYMFGGNNLGQGLAGSTVMLVAVLIILIPWMYYEYGGARRR
ncbi:sugar ABC transporter permease [Rhizobium sp. FKL33]|uniref:carbohydrate ABC transporter permease n=1 Tax=Rhizobium sp. FKL33 TaxID=2562307 RepID=UPI0010BF8A97|nr:sugar ABC transporter permease [Rhizobium sp. FKL33]